MKTTIATTEQQPVLPPDATIPEQVIESAGAAHSDPRTFQDDSTKFHEDALRQYAATFRTEGWLHSGLND
jgi:hypothetical protein